MGPTEEYLLKRIKEEGAIHLVLIDPERFSPKTYTKICHESERAGSAAILIGGSTISAPHEVDLATKAIKRSVKIPVILFPGNISGISRYADAIFFMSLLNSTNPYFIVGAQALGAPLVKKYKLEAIPLGYIIMGSGGAAGVVGYARPIPYNRPEIAAMHALAAQYFGMRLIYLEAGSGATEPIPPEAISHIKNVIDVPLIVGGGIRTGADAKMAVEAGADIIVTGTIVEQTPLVRESLQEIIEGIRSVHPKGR
ncbi:MAG: geranylgeranylglyceryl/heptaprenylglyceryl phosphate synthase [Candidatus Bathyarchaeia archaeon]